MSINVACKGKKCLTFKGLLWLKKYIFFFRREGI